VNLGLEASLAAQHLAPKRRRGFINLIGSIAVLGVAISVAGVIVVVSVMNGFRRDIRDKIIGTSAHVVVNAYGKQGIPDWERLSAQIGGLEGVEGASPYYQGQVMLKSAAGVTGVMVHGILPGPHSRVSKLADNLREGSLDVLEEDRAPSSAEGADDGAASGDKAVALLMGSELRNNLDVGLGDEMTLFSPVFRSTAVGMLPRMGKGKVSGSFQTGYYEYDSSLVYMRLSDAQRLFDAEGQVNQIAVRLTDLELAESVRDAIQRMDDGVSFWAADWQRLNQNLFKALQTEKMIMFIILGCMVLVSAVNIVSTLVMVVMEKQKEIGVLRSLGFSKGSVMRTFLLQGIYIGLGGGTIGFGAGLAVCWVIDSFPIRIPGGGSVYYIETLPVQVQGGDLAFIAAVAFGTCLMAATYPARQAARLDPVEAIRYE
jgi:lipoprotein-releasing system permease protein